jgi:ribosomal-protein-alanine N-acetyltransferase
VSTVELRLITLADVGELTELMQRSREHLKPWDPIRPDSFFTRAGQVEAVEMLLGQQESGTTIPWAIIVDGRIVGRITVTNIVRGPLLSGVVGYFVDPHVAGGGVASAALAAVISQAFGEIGLHRLEAGTLVHNVRSQRVLEKNGFERYGLAPKLLKIGGVWQDHVLFQRINEDLD